MLSESEKIKKAIQKVSAEETERITAPCLRVYKGIITSVPDGTKCKVRLVGDTTEFSLPYAANLSDLTVGAFVWVAVPYGTDKSMNNAIVWSDIKFASAALPSDMTFTKTFTGVQITNKVFTLAIDTTKYKIVQMSFVSYDISQSLGSTALLVYGSDGFLYFYGSLGYMAAITAGTTTTITLSPPGTTWNNNSNVTVMVSYVKK